MTIDTLKTVVLTCIFIVPGFIMNGVINAFCHNSKRSEAMEFVLCLLYSVVHIAIFSWIYVSIWNIKDIGIELLLFIFVCIAITGSLGLGSFIGVIKAKDIIRKILNKLHINICRPIPTAWDDVFSKMECCFIIITLIDGKTICGYYGENSYSSSDNDERDIYLEKTYIINENNNWIETNNSKGVLVHQSQIETIEFLKGETKNGEQ